MNGTHPEHNFRLFVPKQAVGNIGFNVQFGISK